MKTNLSSQISLHRVSPRYYRPENAFEKSVLTRLEKIPTDIYESVEEGANYIAREIAQTIREKQKAGRFCVLALPGGNSPSHVYQELIRMHKEEGLSFRNVIVFNMYEYYPLSSDAINSNFNALKEMLLDHIDIDKQNIFTPDGTIAKDTIFEYCRLYEQRIESFGGIDIALLGIGRVGNIAFNEPGSRLNSTTRLILLDNASRNEASKIFGTLDNTPISSITMGVSTILGAKKVYLLAWGENKAAMIKECVEGPISDTIPASYLQTHNNAHVALDLSAAMNLTRIQRPWLVTSCEWNDKLIRSAIVWLCQLTGKPILKLTNKDYNENGLSELLALYGSAYNVNIKIFNDLQHTITGWPGGKPNADDTYRPERAKPYPKRVIIFSPHPDDDVISMGGTLRRLVEQKHEVHVAYETSGNIAVGDEEVVRFMHFINGFNQLFNNSEDQVINEKYAEIRNFLKEKKDGSIALHQRQRGVAILIVRIMQAALRGRPVRSDFRKGRIRFPEVRQAKASCNDTLHDASIQLPYIIVVLRIQPRLQQHASVIAEDLPGQPPCTIKVILDLIIDCEEYHAHAVAHIGLAASPPSAIE